MGDPMRKQAEGAGSEFDYSEAAHRRRQARLGLALTPAERLRWLEETMEALRRLKGAARLGRPVGRPA